MLKKFETANAQDPESIVLATQKALIDSMTQTLRDYQNEHGFELIRFEQVYEFLNFFRSKKPIVLVGGENV